VKNTYEGYLRNAEVKIGGEWTEISTVFAGLAADAAYGANAAGQISGNLGLLIGAGFPSGATLNDAVTAGYLRPGQRDTIAGGLVQLGLDPSLSLGDIVTGCDDVAAELTASAQTAGQTAAVTDLLFNQEADIVQKGHGFTPIIGVNLAVNDKLNIALKYEFKTKIQVKNERKSQADFIINMTDLGEPIYFLKDGDKVDNDMPAVLSVGIDYKVTPKLTAAAGFHYYWDKGVNYGKQIDYEYVDNSEVIDDNYYELAVGLEYGLTDKLFVSAGYLLAQTGVSKAYQSDLSYSLSSNTFGGGFGYKINDKLMINAGVSYSDYKEDTKKNPHIYRPTGTPLSCTDTFNKNTLILAVGLDLSF
jgi:long-subunit fatty acid transport protein